MSPQFDQSKHPEVGQKRRRGWHSQSQSVSSARFNSKCWNIRKTSTCKYPSLSFDNGIADGLHVKRKGLRRETEADVHQASQTFGPEPSNAQAEVNLATPRRTHSLWRKCKRSTITLNRTHEGSAENQRVCSPSVSDKGRRMTFNTGPYESSVGFSSPNVVSDLIAPDIDTPEMPQKTMPSSKCSLSHLFLPSTPPHCNNSEILVQDTPERDYGLKVTWRKRKELMRLLIKRGQLTNQQVGVTAS